MPGTCTLCGEQRVERMRPTGEIYASACAVCRSEGTRHPGRHVRECDVDDCIVCRDWRAEFGEVSA